MFGKDLKYQKHKKSHQWQNYDILLFEVCKLFLNQRFFLGLDEQRSDVKLQFPMTSIKFKVSCS